MTPFLCVAINVICIYVEYREWQEVALPGVSIQINLETTFLAVKSGQLFCSQFSGYRFLVQKFLYILKSVGDSIVVLNLITSKHCELIKCYDFYVHRWWLSICEKISIWNSKRLLKKLQKNLSRELLLLCFVVWNTVEHYRELYTVDSNKNIFRPILIVVDYGWLMHWACCLTLGHVHSFIVC